jgi:DNA-binding ferritin-like protein
MLSRMMPQQTEATHEVKHTYRTYEEIAERLRQLGLQPQRIYPMLIDEKKPKPN